MIVILAKWVIRADSSGEKPFSEGSPHYEDRYHRNKKIGYGPMLHPGGSFSASWRIRIVVIIFQVG